jgi:hypothetical protein
MHRPHHRSQIQDPTSAVHTRKAEGILVFSTTMNNTLASFKTQKIIFNKLDMYVFIIIVIDWFSRTVSNLFLFTQPG